MVAEIGSWKPNTICSTCVLVQDSTGVTVIVSTPLTALTCHSLSLASGLVGLFCYFYTL